VLSVLIKKAINF